MAFVKAILDGTKTLLTGMKVTLNNFRKPSITSKYPIEKIEMSEAFRNVIVLIEKDDIQSHDCIGCKACERVCPSFCIDVDGERPEGMRRMRATEFKVDFALCSDCGLCLDVCPTDTLGYSKIHDETGYNRSDFVYDLLDPWRDAEGPTVERLRKLEEEQAAAKKARTVKKAAAKKAAAKKAETETSKETTEETPTNKNDAENNDA
ncbi:MAG: 4Fe-4S binding protein [Candidatus Latescibacteria bacterium]|nr:4Fe-4S binding protein [Candidatus Latescibacterota bacterium]